MKIPASIFSPLGNALLSATLKVGAKVEPRQILLPLAEPVRIAEQIEGLAQPLEDLSLLITTAETPGLDAPKLDEVRSGIFTTMERLAPIAKGVSPDLAESFAFSLQRYRTITRPISSTPSEVQRFSERPLPFHSAPPKDFPDADLSEWLRDPLGVSASGWSSLVELFLDPMGIFKLDPQSGEAMIFVANEALREASHYDDIDLLNLSLRKFFHPDDLDKFRAVRREVAKHGRAYSPESLRVIDGDGVIRWVDLRIGLFGHHPIGYFIMVDATDHHLNQEENVTLRSAYNDATQAMSIVVMGRNGHLRVVPPNRSFERQLGYDPGEIQARNIKL